MAFPTPTGLTTGTAPLAPSGQAPPATPTPPQSSAPARPAESFLLADIDRSRDYRKEYYKYAITIATSLLAFTLAFQPTLKTAPENVWMELAGWSGLGVAITAGLLVHLVWAEFFITYRDYDNKNDRPGGKVARNKLNRQRAALEVLLALGLIVGVAGVVGFTAANLHKVAVKSGG